MFTLQVPTVQDDLGADVRVETERRLKSLQKDLEKAETMNKERELAVRYHKVKFFGQFISDPTTRSYLSSGIQSDKSCYGKSIKPRNKRRSTKNNCSHYELI